MTDPARGIIAKLGGPAAVARVTGVHRTRVYSWQRNGGRIPQRHIPVLLAFAREHRIRLRLQDFFPTR